ncbi:MAG: hypothetical protein SOI44_06040 [Lactimicrobium sp.]|jgi:hypothetical protein|uniref:hypothetical protein n=1 Tax=Lactimicrobium sp. TaxID=2563780 RepID=UPI002F360BDC
MNRNTKLKQDDIETVRKIFFDGRCHTRMELCAMCGISTGGMANILKELLLSGQILYVADVPSRTGRHAKQYQLNPEYCHIGMLACIRNGDDFCFEIESRKLDGKLVLQQKLSSKTGSVQDLRHALATLLEKDQQISVLAISVPGVCMHGTIGVCDLPLLANTDLHDIPELEGVQWVNENDANAMCIGLVHKIPDVDTAALVFQPAAEMIGCGIVIHGRLYNGTSHQAGEMRYLPWGTEDQKKETTKRDPARMLAESIGAIAAVLDPDLIAWTSDLIKEDIQSASFGLQLDPHIQLVHVKDKDSLLWTGLYEIGRDILKNRKMGEER